MEENYIYIPRPVAVAACVLLLLFVGGMIGAGLFPVQEQVPCKQDKKERRK